MISHWVVCRNSQGRGPRSRLLGSRCSHRLFSELNQMQWYLLMTGISVAVAKSETEGLSYIKILLLNSL
ncbi:hypothetical protein EVAR_86698_1 [Eumeta japonica]|uniref:Uncharacterized protein n=1 Tax=Eumeta variegata TaxID=151549 RepID=A0A4C1XZ87_EUMVA|nr:hypothetical protein EVAR_86698_1 [Eumeta japonica]